MAKSPLSLSPEIERFRREFERIAIDADAFATPLRDDQFDWRPAPDAWSIADCFDHLNATARTYLPILDEGIGSAIRRGLYGAGPFRYNWIGRLVVRFVQPPPLIRVKASTPFLPAPNRPRSEITAAMRAYQVQFVDRLRQANGLDLARAYVASPVSPWLRLPLGSGFALMVAHERRHLWQAARVTEKPGFP
jgi:hypothetical protein